MNKIDPGGNETSVRLTKDNADEDDDDDLTVTVTVRWGQKDRYGFRLTDDEIEAIVERTYSVEDQTITLPDGSTRNVDIEFDVEFSTDKSAFKITVDPSAPNARVQSSALGKSLILKPDTVTGSVAHEFGHLIGMRDHYIDNRPPKGTGDGSTPPQAGWAGNLMADGRVTGAVTVDKSPKKAIEGKNYTDAMRLSADKLSIERIGITFEIEE